MNKRLVLGLLVLIIIVVIVFIGYLRNKQIREKETAFQEGGQLTPSPIPTPALPLSQSQELPFPGVQQPLSQTSYPFLFKEEFIYIDLFYPLLYVYDPNFGVIKYLDLENETYKEIYKAPLIEEAVISSDKNSLVFKTETEFNFLDLKKDVLYKLPIFTKNFVFTPQGLVIYINNQDVSYLAFYQDGQTKKIKNLGILRPKFESLKNSLLIYEDNSPVFLLDLKNPNNFSMFLEAKPNYSLLANKEQNLIFVSFKDKFWQSQIINLNKNVKFAFPWGTIKEKCSFDDVLVCAVPSSLDNFSPSLWLKKEPNYDEKLVIYNPKDGKLKEVKLETPLDIVKPKLTPLGIVLWNRLDARFYLIKSEKLSL